MVIGLIFHVTGSVCFLDPFNALLECRGFNLAFLDEAEATGHDDWGYASYRGLRFSFLHRLRGLLFLIIFRVFLCRSGCTRSIKRLLRDFQYP